MMMPFLCLLLGAFLGRLLLSPALSSLLGGTLIPILSVVVFCAGFDAGSNQEIHQRLRHRPGRLLLLPLATAVGSLLFGCVAGTLLELPLRESAAVSAGFAYYSVSVGILTDLGGPSLGALALVTNIVREMLAFALIPVVARRLNPLAAVSIGGATSMDLTLPVIAGCSQQEVVVMAIVHGVILTLSVPVLVPLLYTVL